jgi:hypothetical protein
MRDCNPPWSDRAVKESWEAIEAALAANGIPEEWMPRGDLVELGCGHYGCVYPTSDPKIVFKVTTDLTEANFVANYLKLRDNGVQSLGVVQYYEIFGLPQRRFGRNMFVLWREEVPNVGCLDVGGIIEVRFHKKYDTGYGDSYELREWNSFKNHLMHFKEKAHMAKRIADRRAGSIPEDVYWAWMKDQIDHMWSTNDWTESQVMEAKREGSRNPYKFALFAQESVYFAQQMGSEYYGVNVGQALETYLEAGLFLADVHCGNIGLPNEEETDGRQTYAPIITDPGHAILMNPELSAPSILMLDV